MKLPLSDAVINVFCRIFLSIPALGFLFFGFLLLSLSNLLQNSSSKSFVNCGRRCEKFNWKFSNCLCKHMCMALIVVASCDCAFTPYGVGEISHLLLPIVIRTALAELQKLLSAFLCSTSVIC